MRAEIKKYFDPHRFIENSQEIFYSPGRRFRLETSNYHQNKPDVNWDVTKVKVFDNKLDEKLFEFISNYGGLFHAWLQKNGTE